MKVPSLPRLGVVAAIALAGCSSGGSIAPSVVHAPGGSTVGTSATAGIAKIEHVVVIVQENRSFDDIFLNFPGADTRDYGYDHLGNKVMLQPQGLISNVGPDHSHSGWMLEYDNGKNDGWDLKPASAIPGVGGGQQLTSPTAMYAYVPQSDVQPYWTMAQQYTLADRYFHENTGPTFPSHQFLVAGQAGGAIASPTTPTLWGCDAPPGTTVATLEPSGIIDTHFPCYDYLTIADLLDRAGKTWRYYAPLEGSLSGSEETFQANRQIRFGRDFQTNVKTPETQVLTDIQSGSLANMTWVVPDFYNSDIPAGNEGTGPSWVSSIVNAIGASPFWNSTAIFITYDDWGGWYDHVVPPQLDQNGLSYRLPMIVVSTYAKRGYVSHMQHEAGSILKFTEETFGLPSLGTTDVRSDDFLDAFDFTQTPPPFKMISAKYDARYFLTAPHSYRKVDD